MTKKAKEEETLQAPVEETTPVETPVEEEVKEEVAPVEEEKVEDAPVEEVPAENLDPVNEEIPVEKAWEEKENNEEEIASDDGTSDNLEQVPTPVEEENHNVKIEVEKKQISLLWAPEEIRNIIQFYGVTSQDLFDGNVDNMGLKADELKALKEWYATLE